MPLHPVTIELLLVSTRHRYEGRPADGPLPAPEGEPEVRSTIELRAGLGAVGDRYFAHRAHRDAAVTVFDAASLDHVSEVTGVRDLDPAATRRTITVRGFPIDEVVGRPFSLDSGSGPIRFRGHRAANPCAWMDVTLAPGAFRALRGRGGVRCVPLDDGTLTLGRALLDDDPPAPAL
ncbi:molybdenum cofactor biosysynthesis protein [Cnuibacter sp. UC19_7]|uniref:molybdenum cofactor biosysynthesis protein n=1 Tax=Cnuibacter sp. UC19_7 TaxID=3350166 RepID=UPI003671531D